MSDGPLKISELAPDVGDRLMSALAEMPDGKCAQCGEVCPFKFCEPETGRDCLNKWVALHFGVIHI